MKNVTVLYFAALKELTGTATETLALPDRVKTVDDFSSYLKQARPALSRALASVRIARNEVFAGGDEPIGADDVLALIPPVQGG